MLLTSCTNSSLFNYCGFILLLDIWYDIISFSVHLFVCIVFLEAYYCAVSLPNKTLIEMFIEIIIDSNVIVRNETENNSMYILPSFPEVATFVKA